MTTTKPSTAVVTISTIRKCYQDGLLTRMLRSDCLERLQMRTASNVAGVGRQWRCYCPEVIQEVREVLTTIDLPDACVTCYKA